MVVLLRVPVQRPIDRFLAAIMDSQRSLLEQGKSVSHLSDVASTVCLFVVD